MSILVEWLELGWAMLPSNMASAMLLLLPQTDKSSIAMQASQAPNDPNSGKYGETSVCFLIFNRSFSAVIFTTNEYTWCIDFLVLGSRW